MVSGAAAASAPPVRVQALAVGRHAGIYQVRMRARLQASPVRLYAALTDYRALPRINPAIRSVRVLPAAAGKPGSVRVVTVLHACVWFFCKTMHQMQRMTPSGGDRLVAVMIAAHSDFSFGRVRWAIRPCAGASCLTFNARLRPSFWVPPLIGPWFIRRKLREEAVVTLHGLLRLARSEPATS